MQGPKREDEGERDTHEGTHVHPREREREISQRVRNRMGGWVNNCEVGQLERERETVRETESVINLIYIEP